MSQRSILNALRFSPVIFGAVGLFMGLVASRSLIYGLMWTGICFGSGVGIIAALICMILNKNKCVSMASLCANAGLFYVVSRELFIIS